ncbi:hypothetical protein BJ138DRAFT_1169480 [Hygrophoropsis aurantiaca]|uniref:Uncharacterized protein n=1 Tax=Hygrophoropsis aurantiaca TaxID=72124 RepID=A0ACB8ATQ3_9AGAM|nr:hypothetical protein BJ138DRAFT_1169480 [Hygrophoropsis aurantiaca]
MATTDTHARDLSEDLDTELLIAKLTLQDIDDIESSRKGKGREGAPLTDEELAFNEQAESIRNLLNLLADYKFAQSIDGALETDRTHLVTFSVLNDAEEDDHLAALALSRGENLPPPTVFQQALEDPSVLLREPRGNSTGGTSTGSDFSSSDEEFDDSSLEKPQPKPRVNQLINRKRLTQREIPVRVECIICGDRISSTRSFRAPCSHHYCLGCIRDLAEASTRDETLYPLRCCKQQLPMDNVMRLLPSPLVDLVQLKSIEFSTPAASRVYCCNRTCSIYLGGASDDKTDIVCSKCDTAICSACKNPAHPGEECTDNIMTLEVKALAATQGWQTCPTCNAIIELKQGCYHMTCRCSAQFCYLCTALWKTCQCRQWDEERLENEAARRDAVLPGVQLGRVFQQMEELRINHECLDHTWRFRHGGGQCDECGDFLPVFLMRCRNCQMLACRRCSANRL